MSKSNPSQPDVSRSRGRPREFDIEEALDKAIGVFRERGYHATSIGDLAAAMELASGSIYKAFKDKRAIFIAALDRYVSLRGQQLQQRLQDAPTGREKLQITLAFYAESASDTEGRRGCLIVGSAAELATFDPEVADRIKDALMNNERSIVAQVRQGQSDGSITNTADPLAIARLMLCITQGMRVLGKAGQTREEMTAIVAVAMKTLD